LPQSIDASLIQRIFCVRASQQAAPSQHRPVPARSCCAGIRSESQAAESIDLMAMQVPPPPPPPPPPLRYRYRRAHTHTR